MTETSEEKQLEEPATGAVLPAAVPGDGQSVVTGLGWPVGAGLGGVLPPRRRGRRQPSGRTTIMDVARAAGVSVTTVSRVLRNHAEVQDETRALVREAIDRLGYRPSMIARALVSGQTHLLALFVSDITNPFYPQIAKSVEQEAAKAGYMVAICNTEDQVAESRRSLTWLLRQGLDGVIHASVGRDETALLSVLGDHRRIVFINRRPKSSSVSYVVSDNVGGAAALTRYLLEKGHRKIGFIGGPSWARNATDRLRGFMQAMREVPDARACVAEGEFSTESGENAVGEWFASGCDPTAIIAVNDSIAVGAMGALLSRGYEVPTDIALAGFDGTDLAALPVVRLTTVDQHVDEMGRRAVRLLLAQLREPQSFTPVKEVLASQLLVRGSTEGMVRRLTSTR